MNSKASVPFGARLEALKRKKNLLNIQIGEEMKRPLPDWLQLRALKVNRLAKEDRIMALLIEKRLDKASLLKTAAKPELGSGIQ